MSLSPPPPVASTTAAAVAASVLLSGNNMSRMEDHLLTRFQHIDPELVDEYMSGRRRQVSNHVHFLMWMSWIIVSFDCRLSFIEEESDNIFTSTTPRTRVTFSENSLSGRVNPIFPLLLTHFIFLTITLFDFYVHRIHREDVASRTGLTEARVQVYLLLPIQISETFGWIVHVIHQNRAR